MSTVAGGLDSRCVARSALEAISAHRAVNGNQCKVGGKVRSEKELVTLPHNASAKNGASLTRCSHLSFQV